MAWWLWPAPQHATADVMAVAFEDLSARDVRTFDDAPPSPVEADTTVAWTPRTPVWDELPWAAQRRFAWAHERAAWTGGGWVACDLSGLPGAPSTSAELVLDEAHYLGPVDAATSTMATPDDWLTFSVSAPSGRATWSVGELFEAKTRLEVSWEGATGETPGACTVTVLDAEPAVLDVLAVASDGSELPLPADAWIVGCGRTELGGLVRTTETDRCALHLERRNPLLPSQVVVGPPARVTPVPGETTTVRVPLPAAPGLDTLPRLDETLALLDLAAFSGSEVFADHLDVIVDDLEDGRFEPSTTDRLPTDPAFEDLLGEDDTIDDAYGLIQASWLLWARLDETPPGERDGATPPR